jgi:phosphoserine phosphatase RsbU/P
MHAAHPAQVLLGLNQSLCGKFQHHYVTAAYLFVDMEKQTMTYAGAGHPPLLLREGLSKSVRQVEEMVCFSEKFPFATYSSVELPLRAGLKQFLATEQSPSADTFASQLLETLPRWSARGSAEELDDDITMVAIHVRE